MPFQTEACVLQLQSEWGKILIKECMGEKIFFFAFFIVNIFVFFGGCGGGAGAALAGRSMAGGVLSGGKV